MDNKTTDKLVVINLSTLQTVANYLGARPYTEVSTLLESLKSSVSLDSVIANLDKTAEKEDNNSEISE